MMALQVEFPLQVAVCAWCKPKERGAGLGDVSHGICPRHLRKLKFRLQGIVLKRRRRSSAHDGKQGVSEALLSL